MLPRNSLVALVIAAQAPALENLKTTPEASDFTSTSSYEDVVTFMKAVDEASPIVFYTTKQLVAEADKEALVGSAQPTRAQLHRGGIVEILMGEVEDEKNPKSGAIMNRRKDASRPEKMVDMMWFEPTTKEAAPAEYYVPASATKALDLLRAHGVQMRQAKGPISGVQQFTIESNAATQTFEATPCGGSPAPGSYR